MAVLAIILLAVLLGWLLTRPSQQCEEEEDDPFSTPYILKHDPRYRRD